MASIEEVIIGDVQEETEEKIDTVQGFPHLTPNPAVMKTTCRSKLFYSYYYILGIYLSLIFLTSKIPVINKILHFAVF